MDIERFTKDPFRAIGSTPWLQFDFLKKNNTSHLKESNKHSQTEKKIKATHKNFLALMNQPLKRSKNTSRQIRKLTIKSLGEMLTYQSKVPLTSLTIIDKELYRPKCYPYSSKLDRFFSPMENQKILLDTSRNLKDFQVSHLRSHTVNLFSYGTLVHKLNNP